MFKASYCPFRFYFKHSLNNYYKICNSNILYSFNYRSFSNSNKILYTFKSNKQTKKFKKPLPSNSLPNTINNKRNYRNNDSNTPNNKKLFTRKNNVSTNIGLYHFLKKTYLVTGGGISMTLASSQIFYHIFMCTFGSSIVGLSVAGYSLLVFYLSKPNYVYGFYGLEVKANPLRYCCFTGLAVGLGLFAAPIASGNPLFLPIACILSVSTMGSASLYVLSNPSSSNLILKTSIVSAVGGLIGVSLSHFICELAFGFENPLSNVLHSVDLYGGIFAYSLLTAYHTVSALERYKNKEPDQIACAITLYIDFLKFLLAILFRR